MFKNIRKKTDINGNITGYVVTMDSTAWDYDIPQGWQDAQYSYETVHTYATAHPNEVSDYIEPIFEQLDEIAELKEELGNLDWQTTKAIEEATLLGMTLFEYVNTAQGASYKAAIEQKKILRARINSIEDMQG